MIALTPRAAEALKSYAAKASAAGFGLRVQLLGGGCSGFLYDLTLVEGGGPQDERVQTEGLTVWVDGRAAPFVEGMVIDFATTEYGPAFLFQNPRARVSCSCGASFEP